MRYLLDTHVWLWSLESPGKLPAKIRHLIYDAESLPFRLSAISPWEVIKKECMGRLTLSCPVRDWLSKGIRGCAGEVKLSIIHGYCLTSPNKRMGRALSISVKPKRV